jgi:hypothetical protein
MTTKHIHGSYPSGYALAADYSELIVDRPTRVGGPGVSSAHYASIVNFGDIDGTSANGVSLSEGGRVRNGGTIQGKYIGLYLRGAGTVTNGSPTNTRALISGPEFAVMDPNSTTPVTVANFGTLEGGFGVSLFSPDARVINGSFADTSALIEGTYDAVELGNPSTASTLINFGSIVGAVYLGPSGGQVTNGSAADETATMAGGVDIGNRYLDPYPYSATVTNFGTIHGVYLPQGGTLTNGSESDRTAVLSGNDFGAELYTGRGMVANFGTIEGGRTGLDFGAEFTGSLANGSTTDVSAVISGVMFGLILGSATTVTNFGTIRGETAIELEYRAPDLVNGSAADTAALISGAVIGIQVDEFAYSSARASNFGTITSGDIGVNLVGSATVVNGSATDVTALIAGAYQGVLSAHYDGSATTVINFGTIRGSDGISVQFANGADSRVIAEAGSTWIGALFGGGGALELASGAGAIAGLGARGIVSGAEAMTFSGFGAYDLDAGSSWVMTGPNALSSSQSLTLAAGGALTMAGAAILNVSGTVDQSGALTIGDATANKATVSILDTGVWDIDGGIITHGVAAGSRIVNRGQLVSLAVAGTSSVGVMVVDDGAVEAASGTLDLTGEVTGTGSLKIDAGAVLEVGATATKALAVIFDGSGATLALAHPARFGATIDRFAPTDNIDLIKIAASAASVNDGDQLVITDGARTVATLQLAGTYGGDTFDVGPDGAGGTDITLSAPSIPAAHGMVTAIAQLGARAGHSAGLTVDAHPDAWRPAVLAPRVQVA